MAEQELKALSDMASEAHARIQATYQHIHPVVGARPGMREFGIPADAMTIDCLQTRRRILLVLHDEEPGTLLFQFGSVDGDMGEVFRRTPLNDAAGDYLGSSSVFSSAASSCSRLRILSSFSGESGLFFELRSSNRLPSMMPTARTTNIHPMSGMGAILQSACFK